MSIYIIPNMLRFSYSYYIWKCCLYFHFYGFLFRIRLIILTLRKLWITDLFCKLPFFSSQSVILKLTCAFILLPTYVCIYMVPNRLYLILHLLYLLAIYIFIYVVCILNLCYRSTHWIFDLMYHKNYNYSLYNTRIFLDNLISWAWMNFLTKIT